MTDLIVDDFVRFPCITLVSPFHLPHTGLLPILNEEEAFHQIVKDSSSTSNSGHHCISTLESGLM